MSTNKAELVKLNGYGAISINDEAANIFYSFSSTYIPYNYKKMWNQMEIN